MCAYGNVRTVTDREACLALMSSIVMTHRQRERAHVTLPSLLHCSGPGRLHMSCRDYRSCGMIGAQSSGNGLHVGALTLRSSLRYSTRHKPKPSLLIIAVPLRTAARRKAGEHATAATAPICKALLPSYCTFFLPLGSLSSCFRAAYQSATHPLQRFAAYAAALRGPGL